ncbi:Protein CBG02996 [Caenorhabditis briggsae]|uniref:Protein CBG02996 n=1 Tax=Caenorhabditis briggsae TaxID=6238 RepID=A8WT16_CAEBR|nr:Protein CBG02996 [Caenorhabditis briggsae]CAP23627.1 Protein CBG02996 [Caenorhabditis briggsae]
MKDDDDSLVHEASAESLSSQETEETTTAEPTADPFGEDISSISCKYGMAYTLEALLNSVAPGWKYHVSNTGSVKQTWFKMDNATSRICGHIGGLD